MERPQASTRRGCVWTSARSSGTPRPIRTSRWRPGTSSSSPRPCSSRPMDATRPSISARGQERHSMSDDPQAHPEDYGSMLSRRIAARTARVSVIGQGYVGLPLAVEFANAGFTVAGLDTDLDRVAALGSGLSGIPDVPSAELQALIRAGRYQATPDAAVLAVSDVVIICVPTPLRKSKDPDISYVVAAAEEAARRFRPGQLVILESTTYPGTTEELLLPMFQAAGATIGEHLHLALSPDRRDPRNPMFRVEGITKVVGC